MTTLSTASGRAGALPLAEHFTSINGEGPRAGQLSCFLRVGGCNLSCGYCDTAWANEDDVAVEWLDSDEIVALVDEARTRCVTLTGGEPLLQPAAGEVLYALLGHDPGLFVEVETNGSVPLEAVAALRRVTDKAPGTLRITMDYKMPSSGMFDQMVVGNLNLLDADDVVKFVVGDVEDLSCMLDVATRHDLFRRCNVYLSPVTGMMDPALVVDFMKEHHLADARLQLQLHRIVWPEEARGV
ncbi:MAG: radical SAM protein [Coriobacteriales bacterium]